MIIADEKNDESLDDVSTVIAANAFFDTSDMPDGAETNTTPSVAPVVFGNVTLSDERVSEYADILNREQHNKIKSALVKHVFDTRI